MSGTLLGEVWVTYDGQTWSGALGGFENGVGDGGVTAAAVVARPDGYIQLYATEHSVTIRTHDWLTTLTSRSRVLDTVPTVTSDNWENAEAQAGFHSIEGTPANPLSANPLFQGFEWVAATVWKGQVILLATAHWETAGPTFTTSGLQMYRLNHWQPLQERLNFVESPNRGLVYNRTWEPYALGSYFGWTAAGAGLDAVVDVSDGSVAGGYRWFITTGNARSYADTSIPDADSGYGGALRFVMWPHSGGDTTSDQMGLVWKQRDGANGTDIRFRFKKNGSDAEMVVHDAHAAADIGNISYTEPATSYQGGWIEVLAYVDYPGSLTVYTRMFNPLTDPEWDDTYDVVTSSQGLTIASLAAEGIEFGNPVSGTAESRWKTVQLHRIEDGDPDMDLISTSFVDEDFTEILRTSDTENKLHDSGYANFPRTPFITAEPQYISKGISASFRGEATLTGNYDYETGYDYAGRNMLEGPTVREWRSTESTSGVVEDITVLIDGGAARQFKPTGLAVFGRNFTSMRVQMNDTDVWTSPLVDMTLGTPNDLLTPDRYTHLWSTQNATSTFATELNNAQLICMDSSSGVGPWRAHQFRSQEGGPKYYVMIKDISGDDADRRKIYRILDNDEGMLVLNTDPTDDGFTDDLDFDIISDRFAVFIGARHSISQTTYRYIRLTFYGCNHRDTDENFHRMGRVMLGYAHNLSKPMFDWGWSYTSEAGQEITEADNGVRYSQRRHAPRRQFDCTYRLLRGNQEATEVLDSPESAYSGTSGQFWPWGSSGQPKTWGTVMNMLQTLQSNGERCALVWEGDRAEDVGASSAVVQTAAEPLELLMVRVADVGAMTQVAYQGQTKNLAGGDECRPTPMLTGSLSFEEEF